MVKVKLLEVNPPSGRVPGRGLLVLPILEARRQRNRGEIGKKGFVFGGFGSRDKYRRRGQPGGPQGVQAAPWRGPTLGRTGRAPGALVGPLWPPLGDFRSLFYADFYWIFPEFFEHFLYGGNLK